MRLIDIHCHVLPYVDDGAEDMEEAIEILEESYRQGIRHMIVTPHYRKEFFETPVPKIVNSYRALRKEAAARGIQIFLGCEYFRDTEIYDQIYEQISGKKRVTLAGTKYMLVEFSIQDTFSYIRNFTYQMKTQGIQPIIAHVERYENCWTMENIQELHDCGVQIQLNAATVLGQHGWANKKMCLKLMKNDLIDYIASDTHNVDDRAQNLKKCADYVEKKMGSEYAKKIFFANPSKILKSR